MRLWLIAMLWFLSVTHTAVAQPQIFDDQARQLIDEMVAERAKLNSGIFRAKGIFHRNDGNKEPIVTQSDYFCAFDREKGLLRCNCSSEIVINVQQGPATAQEVRDAILRSNESKSRVRPLVARLIVSPEYFTEWFAIGHHHEPNHATTNINICSPLSHPTMHQFERIIDPAVLGTTPYEMFRFGHSLRDTLNEYAEHAETVTWQGSTAEAGIESIAFTNRKFERVIHVSSGQYRTAHSMSGYHFAADGTQQQFPRVSSEVEWSIIDDVAVPVKFFSSHSSHSEHAMRHEYTFEWEAVNPEELPAEWFSYHSFEGVWDGIRVYDSRDGNSIYIDTIQNPEASNP